jgi:hypothetical protein
MFWQAGLSPAQLPDKQTSTRGSGPRVLLLLWATTSKGANAKNQKGPFSLSGDGNGPVPFARYWPNRPAPFAQIYPLTGTDEHKAYHGVSTENLSSGVVVVKSAQDGV